MTNKGPFSGLQHFKIEGDHIYFTVAINQKAQPFLFSDFKSFVQSEFSELCKKNNNHWPDILVEVNKAYFPVTLFLQKFAA